MSSVCIFIMLYPLLVNINRQTGLRFLLGEIASVGRKLPFIVPKLTPCSQRAAPHSGPNQHFLSETKSTLPVRDLVGKCCAWGSPSFTPQLCFFFSLLLLLQSLGRYLLSKSSTHVQSKKRAAGFRCQVRPQAHRNFQGVKREASLASRPRSGGSRLAASA